MYWSALVTDVEVCTAYVHFGTRDGLYWFILACILGCVGVCTGLYWGLQTRVTLCTGTYWLVLVGACELRVHGGLFSGL